MLESIFLTEVQFFVGKFSDPNHVKCLVSMLCKVYFEFIRVSASWEKLYPAQLDDVYPSFFRTSIINLLVPLCSCRILQEFFKVLIYISFLIPKTNKKWPKTTVSYNPGCMWYYKTVTCCMLIYYAMSPDTYSYS